MHTPRVRRLCCRPMPGADKSMSSMMTATTRLQPSAEHEAWPLARLQATSAGTRRRSLSAHLAPCTPQSWTQVRLPIPHLTSGFTAHSLQWQPTTCLRFGIGLELRHCADGKACDPAGDDTFRSGFMAIAQRIMAEAGACPVRAAVDLGCEAAGTTRLREPPYPVGCAPPTSIRVLLLVRSERLWQVQLARETCCEQQASRAMWKAGLRDAHEHARGRPSQVCDWAVIRARAAGLPGGACHGR